MVSETASGIAHQINQPLAVLSSMAQRWQAMSESGDKALLAVVTQEVPQLAQQSLKMGDIIHRVNNAIKRLDVEMEQFNVEVVFRPKGKETAISDMELCII